MFQSNVELLKYVKDEAVEFLTCAVCDPLGGWNHFTFHVDAVTENDLAHGFAFDSSSLKLMGKVEKSDMMMVPDAKTAFLDPFCKHKTIHVVCSVTTALGDPHERCPRQIAKRAVNCLKQSGVGDEAFFGPEPEFFIFDSVDYRNDANCASFTVTGAEGFWEGGAKGHQPGPQGFYTPAPPIDTMHDIRSEMLAKMKDMGVPIEKHHHEVATCQHELGFRYADLLTTADRVMTYKYVVKNVAASHGKTATFMPKPLQSDNGSGMHIHMSIWKSGQNVFWKSGECYFNLSDEARWFIGGIIKHSGAVLAFTNPTVNSYKRLVPGFEAPVNLVYSMGNRSAAIRLPLADALNPKGKRFECRFPDASCCPYLAFAAVLLAGLDGVKGRVEPPAPMDKDLYHLTEEEKSNIKSTPASLDAALDELEQDQNFLISAFPETFIKSYIQLRRKECQDVALAPSPKEFEMYYRC